MKPDAPVIRCPDCDSTARSLSATVMRCNFCGRRFAPNEGVTSTHKPHPGNTSRIYKKHVRKAPTGKPAGKIVCGRGFRWWSGLV
jgi:ribosomal protein S27E